METKLAQKQKFVFFEGSGKRWRYSKLTFLLSLILIITLIGFIFRGIALEPSLTELSLEGSPIEPISLPVASSEDEASLDSIKEGNQVINQEVYAFYDHNQYQVTNKIAFKNQIDQIDVVIPNWYYVNDQLQIMEEKDREIDEIAQKNQVKIYPRLSFAEDVKQKSINRLLEKPEMRTSLIKNLHQKVKEQGYDGIHIQLEGIGHENKEYFLAFMSELYQDFHSADLIVALHIRPKDSTYDSKLLSEVSDRVVINVFDQHIETGGPGPLASFNWSKEIIESYEGPLDKLVVCLASYGYDWNETSGERATPLFFHNVMDLVTNHGLEVQWDKASLTPYVRYKESGDDHILWFLDGVTFHNQVAIAMNQRVGGIGVWNIGSEDPTIWASLSNGGFNPSALRSIPSILPFSTSGSGDIFRVSKTEEQGKRQVEFDHSIIVDQTYKKYPTPYHIERYGNKEKKIAISFDDGPDPRYTKAILDILKEYDVKAAFFIIGSNAALYPQILKQINEEGHEIGNHTFTHSNILDLSATQMDFELNATQRVIQSATGQSSLLFRPPFLSTNNEGEDRPSLETLKTLLSIQEKGYTIVGSDIDLRDWDGKTADEIFEETKRRVESEAGNIILLHDAGGDRRPTIEALPHIIEYLQAEGYSIVPVSELIDKTRSEVMPSFTSNEGGYKPFYQIGSALYYFIVKIPTIFLYTIIMIGVIRLLILGYYSMKHKRNSQKITFNRGYNPFVSILIAAYNEEKVIRQTIQTILKSNYPHFEVIIVDDGSKDQTSEVIGTHFGSNSKVRLINKINGGKSSALNVGLLEAKGEIIVTLDADTIITEDAVSLFVRHFSNPKVGAVSGNVKIGNIKNLITLWQHVEYVTGFNLEKRAFDQLNCIPVVPGAIGAWRKTAIEEVNNFEEDTLAEDTDVTMKLLREGYYVRCEEGAIAYTEAPETVRSFIKQRYRWIYGILQCVWKHRKATFSMKQKGLGFIAMPNMIYQYVLQAASPLIDILLIIGLLTQNPTLLYFYLGFFLVDFLVTMYSFRLEKESQKPLFFLIIQRFVYRQFFTYVVWKSLVFALKGGLMGWNKLNRTGNVQQPIQKAKVGA
ncbi:polysaccharide deacetylase family protein [Halalkalibacter okhensis]|uniref:Uncharacterized protein n=1 Tax=Halalkalibacter okhensis TaxID=333138 RepID=A0A0B0IB02_9BACI|nr:polysaccharide deacetylase family protein [Halalkalibacter okhensis]KHF38455.1 hypothetical protein LQ50_21220 [Halalkalibacter okhensis]